MADKHDDENDVEIADIRNPKKLTEAKFTEMKKTFAKIVVAKSDMSSDILSEATDMLASNIDKIGTTFEAASRAVKEQMDRKFGPTWHCIIGEGFGFDVTHHAKYLLYAFYQGKIGILLYKC